MNLNNIRKYANFANVCSLVLVLIGLAISSMSLAIISLLVFCLSGQIGLSVYLADKAQRVIIVNDLLRDGVFDEVLDIPEETIKRLKL